MHTFSPVHRRNTSLEKPREPHGKVLRVRASRGHVSPWLLPSRRGPAAHKALLRLRWLLLVLGAFVAAQAWAAWDAGQVTATHARGPILFVVAVVWILGAALPRGDLWWRVVPPALLLLAVTGPRLLLDAQPLKDPWVNGSAAACAIACLLGWDALRIDAVRRLPRASRSALDRRERIELLRLPAWARAVTVLGLIASAALLFIMTVLDLF